MEKTFTGSELDIALGRLAADTQGYVGKQAVNAVLSTIPAVRTFLTLLNDVATERFIDRTIEMFTIMRDMIERMDKEKLDASYWSSEDFPPLVFLAMEQLKTSHDKKKIRMLATGLSNCASRDFASEGRKEDFFRILHDLSPTQVRYLEDLKPSEDRQFIHPRVKNPVGDAAVAYATLGARGLLQESFESDRPVSAPRISASTTEYEIRRFLDEIIRRVPIRVYEINEFGIAFLRFLTEEAGKLSDDAAKESGSSGPK